MIATADKWVKDNPNSGDVLIWDILDLEKTLNLLPSEKIANRMYQNKDTYSFKKVTSDWGLDKKYFSNGAAYADDDDDDDDGDLDLDLDLVVNNINEEAFIYKNNTKKNYIRVALKSKKNKPVLGTRINLNNKEAKQVIETTNVRGIYSTSEAKVHFGLGNEKKVGKIKLIGQIIR